MIVSKRALNVTKNTGFLQPYVRLLYRSRSTTPKPSTAMLRPTELAKTTNSDFDHVHQSNGAGKAARQYASVGRQLRNAASAMATRGTLSIVSGTAAGIWSLSAVEAALLLYGGGQLDLTASNALFVWAYGAVQILPSCIWSTVPAETVAAAFDIQLAPDSFLSHARGQGMPGGLSRILTSDEAGSVEVTNSQSWSKHTTASGARLHLAVHILQSLRSLLGGSVLLSQVFRAIGASQRALTRLEYRISDGREPMLSGVNERVVRLAGRASDVTALSMRLHGEHIVPVFEDPTQIQHLIQDVQKKVGASVPVFWRVEPGEYGFRHSWMDIGLSDEWMMRTSTGRRLLVVEADATNSEEALAIARRSRDLTLEDAAQASRVLEQVAKLQLQDTSAHAIAWSGWARGERTIGQGNPYSGPVSARFRLLRVFLGNSRQEFQSGGGCRMTLRERVKAHRSVDVVIDSRAPVLLALLRWTSRLAHEVRLMRKESESETEQDTNDSKSQLKEVGSTQDPGSSGASRSHWLQQRWRPTEWFYSSNVQRLRTRSRAETSDGGNEPDTRQDSGKTSASTEAEIETLRPALVLSTGEEDYFASLESLLGEYGFRVLDHASLKQTDTRQLPHVFYHKTTAETVTAVVDLIRAGAVDPRLCCAVVDKVEGAEDLRAFMSDREARKASRDSSPNQSLRPSAATTNETCRQKQPESNDDSDDEPDGMEKESEIQTQDITSEHDSQRTNERTSSIPASLGLEIVCAAELYDGLLRQVRSWAREGHSADAIQDTLDEQFLDVLEQQDGVAARKEASNDDDDNDSSTQILVGKDDSKKQDS